MRWIQDSINPRSRPFVFYLSSIQDDAFPYEFASVIGIFHAYVIDGRPGSVSQSPKLIEFLWLRRMELDHSHRSGWRSQRLHRLSFIPAHMGDAFAFINPSEVIRGIHLIPAFSFGRTTSLLGLSSIRHEEEKEDWVYYYVNQYVLL
jgi:hypothetical protein